MPSSLVLNGQAHQLDYSDPITPWWSFTKTVLAATALSLVRDGLIELDEPVLNQPFTLRQLLRHEAGLADYGELAEYHAAVAGNEDAWPVIEMMQRLEGARLRYSLGTGWRYSNVGYLFVVRLIEQLTELTLEESIRRRILTPLGLSSVRFAKTRADLKECQGGNTLNCDPAWVYHGLLMAPSRKQRYCWIDSSTANSFPRRCSRQCRQQNPWAGRFQDVHGSLRGTASV